MYHGARKLTAYISYISFYIKIHFDFFEESLEQNDPNSSSTITLAVEFVLFVLCAFENDFMNESLCLPSPLAVEDDFTIGFCSPLSIHDEDDKVEREIPGRVNTSLA